MFQRQGNVLSQRHGTQQGPRLKKNPKFSLDLLQLLALGGGNVTAVNDAPVLVNNPAALTFDGVNDYGTTSGFTLNNNASFSWEFWSYRDGTSFDLALGQGASASDQGLHIGYRGVNISDNPNVFVFGFWGNDLNYTSGTDVGQWVHWAGTYDGTSNQRILYKNGAQVATDTSTGDYTGSGNLFVGNWTSGSWALFDGKLDDMRLWSDVRTGTEISENYTRQLAGNETDLLAYWRFDEGTGTTAYDLAANGGAQNLTFSGSPAWTEGSAPVERDDALVFDGVDDVVTVSGIDLANNSFS